MLEKDGELDLYSDMTILCVDDEDSILRSLQRLFHRKTYRVIVAQSAEQALLIVQNESVNLIISDMRMPKMDGAQLLQQVSQLHPEIYRVILSGYADFESTVAAINLGKIHRFINKPWNNNELISVVEEGLEKIVLKQENARLRLIVEQKNAQLELWNQELEDKISLRTKQIHKALKINERNNKASDKMLFNFIAINPNLSGDFARNVARLAGRLADKLGLDKQEINDIRLAGLLTEIGMLALDPLICSTPYTLLNHEQKKKFLQQGAIAKQILSPAQHLSNVRDIIVHQYQLINELVLPEELKMGVKILVVARDYCRFANGRILQGNLDHIHIRIELNKEKGTKYAEEVINILKAHPELAEDVSLERGITTQQLTPGMLLKYNLYTSHHLLILAEGHEFTQSSIDNLIEYEKNQKQVLSVVIDMP
ncbi:MAG: response regulator [Colwellia sp.]|nr:response regulator [Colwellia sp.]